MMYLSPLHIQVPELGFKALPNWPQSWSSLHHRVPLPTISIIWSSLYEAGTRRQRVALLTSTGNVRVGRLEFLAVLHMSVNDQKVERVSTWGLQINFSESAKDADKCNLQL